MKEDNFLENLVYKMVKAIDKKNQESFFNLKSTFVSDKEKEKYISKKAKKSNSEIVFCGEKFAKDLEKKLCSLQKKANFVSRDAYYELMQSGYKAEKISIRKNSISVPVLCNQQALVLKSKEDFEKFVKQHENNFNWDIEKRMRA